MNIKLEIYSAMTLGVVMQVHLEHRDSMLPGRWNGPADAYRHILLAAELTRVFGEPAARALLTTHEFTGNHDSEHPQTSEEYAMDVHNNELGINIGNNAESWSDVVGMAREKFDWEDRNNPTGAVWLDTSKWDLNPEDESTADPHDRIPNGDTRLNWPPVWPDGPFVDGEAIVSGMTDVLSDIG